MTTPEKCWYTYCISHCGTVVADRCAHSSYHGDAFSIPVSVTYTGGCFYTTLYPNPRT